MCSFFSQKSGEVIQESMVGLCCKSGPIVGQLCVQKKGYVVGNDIPFTAKIENHSSRKLNVRVVLQQVSISETAAQTITTFEYFR